MNPLQSAATRWIRMNPRPWLHRLRLRGSVSPRRPNPARPGAIVSPDPTDQWFYPQQCLESDSKAPAMIVIHIQRRWHLHIQVIQVYCCAAKSVFLNEASKWPIGSWNQYSQRRLKFCPGGSGSSSPSTESCWGLFGASLEWTLEISQYNSLISIVNLCTTAYKDQPAWAQSNLPWERPLVARAQSIQCKSHCCAVYSHFQSSGEERAQLPSQSGCKCVAAWLLTMYQTMKTWPHKIIMMDFTRQGSWWSWPHSNKLKIPYQ